MITVSDLLEFANTCEAEVDCLSKVNHTSVLEEVCHSAAVDNAGRKNCYLIECYANAFAEGDEQLINSTKSRLGNLSLTDAENLIPMVRVRNLPEQFTDRRNLKMLVAIALSDVKVI